MSVGYIANDFLGVQMAQCVYGPQPTGIWVTCIVCGRRDRIPNSDACRALTNDQAREIFESHGWSVKPTLCPDHKKEDGMFEQAIEMTHEDACTTGRYEDDFGHVCDCPHDELFCAAGRACPSWTSDHPYAAPIGFHLDSTEDSYGREREDLRWHTAWVFPSALTLWFCEDCSSRIASGSDEHDVPTDDVLDVQTDDGDSLIITLGNAPQFDWQIWRDGSIINESVDTYPTIGAAYVALLEAAA